MGRAAGCHSPHAGMSGLTTGRAENSQYYLAGQVQTSAEERALDRTDGVAVLTIRLRCRYYKTRGA